MCSSGATDDRSAKETPCGKPPPKFERFAASRPPSELRLTGPLATAALAVLTFLAACATPQQSANIQSLETSGPLFDTVAALDAEVFIKDFGAIAQGVLTFCRFMSGTCEGAAEFLIVWCHERGKWSVTRDLSYGHRQI
jgi:hypothetical protein